MKDYIVLVLFIIIIYLLFTNNDSLNESFTIASGQAIDNSVPPPVMEDNTGLSADIKNKIKTQCDNITQNINYILKATNDAVFNDNNFQFIKTNININNIIADNVNIEDNLYVNGNVRIEKRINDGQNIIFNHKKEQDNSMTPIRKLNIFPDNMIVAYNMIEVKPDKTEIKYNLPPGWVKCDGKIYYTFIQNNKTIAVMAGYNKYTNKYNDTQELSIDTEFMQNNQDIAPIKKIIVPDLRGRFVYGASNDDTLDKYMFTKDDNISTQQKKGGGEYVKLKVNEISHNHLTHIGLESNTAKVVYGNGYPLNIETSIGSGISSNFLSFNFALHNGGTIITTSDFYKGGYTVYNNELNYTDSNNHDIPHKNMPPFHTLIYIMKIASDVILP